MKIYSKYFAKNFTVIFLTIFFSLLSLVWLTQSLRFINIITNQGVSILAFLKLSVMLVTPLAYIIMPIALMLAALIFMNHINHDKELVILRSCGLSNLQIAKPIIYVCVLATILSYAISAYFLPKTYREFKNMQDVFRNKYVSLLLEEGIFNTQVKNFTVYIDSSNDEGVFKGIFIYDNRNLEKPVTIMADYGELKKGATGPELTLYKGTQQEENKKTGHVSMVFFDSYQFNLSFLSSTKEFERFYDANELYIGQLLYGEGQKKYDPKFVVHGNQRLVWPLYSFGLPVMLLAIMLSVSFSRREYIYKNIIIVAFSSFFVISALGFHNMALKNMGLIWLIYANILMVLSVALIKLCKPHLLSLDFIGKIPRKSN